MLQICVSNLNRISLATNPNNNWQSWAMLLPASDGKLQNSLAQNVHKTDFMDNFVKQKMFLTICLLRILKAIYLTSSHFQCYTLHYKMSYSKEKRTKFTS